MFIQRMITVLKMAQAWVETSGCVNDGSVEIQQTELPKLTGIVIKENQRKMLTIFVVTLILMFIIKLHFLGFHP